MAYALDVRRLGLSAAAVLLTAALLWFGTGMHPFWPLMWFAPLPVLLFAADATWWGALIAAYLACALGNLNLWDYFHSTLGAPLSIMLRIYLTLGLMFALGVLLYRALLRRRAYWSALLAFPAFWTCFEYLLNLTSPHGTAGSLSYSQMSFLPFLQLASITGPWGMTFLLLLFSTALAIAIHLYRSDRHRALNILLVSGGVIAAVLVFGIVRLMLPAPDQPVKVGLVASDARDNGNVADEGAPTAELFKAYAPSVAALAAQGADVVVLPEKLGVTVEPDTKAVDAELQSLAEQTHVRIVAGLIRVVPPSASNIVKIKYNEARVYTPGAPVLSYDKQHMLPPYESNLTPGSSLTLMAAAGGAGSWGVEICKDMDFTQPSRQYGEAGAGLMLVPAWDFVDDHIEHGHIAIMRGVEGGFTVVRSAKRGSIYVSDNRGRILAEVKSDSAPFATLLATVPATHDSTLFQLLGDWFAWVALALLVFVLAQLIRLWKSPQR
jgi:apolipoprotein N-acyltransferase